MGYGHDDGPSRLSRSLARHEAAMEDRASAQAAADAEAEISAGLSRLGRVIINAATDRLAYLRAEATANTVKEETAVRAHEVPALAYHGVVAELLRKFGGYTLHGEVYTNDLGLVYVSPDGRDLALAGGDAVRRTKFGDFVANLPTGGCKYPGTPTGKSVADVAGETATRVGGSFREARDGEDFGNIVYRPVVVTTTGTQIEFPVGARPAHERPWLRGGLVTVGGRCATLADFWASLKG